MASQSTEYRVSPETMAHLKDVVDAGGVDEVLSIFKALADERRINIMRLLAVSNLCVCDLVEVFDIEYSKLSYHLKVLKEAGLVTAERDGNYVTYRPTELGDEVVEIVRDIC